MNIRIIISIVVCLLVLPGKLTGQDWQLVWSDEFEGESLDQGKWSYMIGDGSDYGIPGWGNNEGQYYLEQNATIRDSMLIFTAKKELVGGILMITFTRPRPRVAGGRQGEHSLLLSTSVSTC